MADIFRDLFNDTSGTELSDHTPEIGTGWTRVWQGDTPATIKVNSSGYAEQQADESEGSIYSADGTYPSADYFVSARLVSISGGADDPIYLFLRMQDVDNMYAVRFVEEEFGSSQIYKKVSGTWTALGSTFTTPENGKIVKFGVSGTSLEVLVDGVLVASATDSDISSAGKAGLGGGGGSELVTSTDDQSTFNTVDEFFVGTELDPVSGTDVSETCATDPSTGTKLGDTAFVTDHLRFTEAVNFKSGRFNYIGDLEQDFEMSFEFWAGGGSGADSNFFYWGAAADFVQEDSEQGQYVVAAQEFRDKIELYWDGILLTDADYVSELGDSKWRTMHVICNGNNIKVYINSVMVIDYTDTTRTLGGTRFGWGGRCGGTNNEHRGRNFQLSSPASGGATLEQEGFAFGDDDGSESAHTLDTQDTNITEPLGTKTLRLLVDAAGDPDSIAYKLKYQKDGAGGYVDVPVGATSGGDDLVIEDTDTHKDGNNVTSTGIGITLPAFSAGDLVIIAYNLWNNNGTPTVTWASGPDGETVTDLINGYGASGQHGLQLCIGYFIATDDFAGGAMANDSTVATRWSAAIAVVPTGEFDTDTPISSEVGSANSASDVPDIDMPSFSAGATDGGGKLLAFVGADQDPFNPTMPSGWTNLEIHDYGRSAMILAGRDAAVTDSETIAAATFDLNGAAADAIAVYAFIVRAAPGTDNEVYISESANVAAGGEATTARLAAPSGKTTGDFDTGRRWDDENGDSIDITDDGYTELEWVLTTQSPAATDDYFEFRVYNGDVALDTYTVTPKWTIGAGGTNHEKDLSDSTTPTDSFAKTVTVARTESSAPADALAKTVERVSADSATPSDAISKEPGKVFTETITGNDSTPTKDVGKGLAETPTMAEAIAKEVGQVQADSASFVDTISKEPNKILADSTTPTDELSSETGKAIGLADSATPADALVREVVKGLGETASITEATAKEVQRVQADSATVADDISKQPTKVLGDTTTPSDADPTTDTGSGLNLSDSTSIIDAASKEFTKAQGDSSSLTDAIVKEARLVQSETVTISESLAKDFHKLLTDTSSPADSQAVSVGKSINLADTASPSDTISKQPGKGLAESTALSDALVREIQKAISEPIVGSETLTKLFTKALSESLPLTDEATTAMNPALMPSPSSIALRNVPDVAIMKSRGLTKPVHQRENTAHLKQNEQTIILRSK